MKSIFSVVAVSVFAFAPFFASAEEIDHAVRAASVFSDRAVVTRAGTVHVKTGRNEIVFSGVPIAMDPRTIRAGAVPEGIKILGVSYEQRISKSVSNAEIVALETKLDAAKKRRATLENERAAAETRVKIIDQFSENLRKSSARDGGKNASADAEKLATETQKIFESIEKSSAEIRALSREIDALEKSRAKLVSGNERRTMSVTVALDAATETDIEIPIVYATPAARWSPVYDVRVFSDPARATEFSCAGLVSQKTGEDWRGVRLTLSTARAQIAALPPEPERVVISGKPVDPASRKIVETTDGSAATESADERANAAAFVEKKSSRQEPVVFAIDGVCDVKSGGEARRVEIASAALSGVVSAFEAAPRARPGVFIRATAKNGAPFPVLAGEANLYRDAGFVGKTKLADAPENAEFSFFAGAADGLVVSTETLPTFEEKRSGIFSKKGAVDIFEGEIYTLVNLTNAPQKIRVRSQIKVSEIDDVKIEICDAANAHFSATTPGYVLEKETGMLYWDVEVPAGDETKICLSTRTSRE